MPSGMILDPLEEKDLGAPIFGDLNRTSLDQRLPELLDLIPLTDACDVSSASRSSRINARFIFEKLLGAHHKQRISSPRSLLSENVSISRHDSPPNLRCRKDIISTTICYDRIRLYS
jgi:hypothetical protein